MNGAIMTKRSLSFFLLSIIAGSIIGWIDTRPQWDDTGITVSLIIITSAILGGGFPRYFWLWGLIVGGIIAGFNVVLFGNYPSSVAIIIAIGSSGISAAIRKNISSDSSSSKAI